MVKSMKPGKAKRLRAQSTFGHQGHYCITIGSPNQPGAVRQFVRDSKAREKMIAALDEWVWWCHRYNAAGLAAIENAKEAVGSAVFDNERRTIDCTFDGHYAQTIRLTYWSTAPEEATK